MNDPSTREERRSRFARRYLLVAPKLTLALRHVSAGAPQDATDIVQDVFVDLLAKIDSSDAPHAVEGLSDSDLAKYLVRAVRNRWIDRKREYDVRERSYKELLRAMEPSPTPEELLLDTERTLLLRRSIEMLGSQHRELLQALLEGNSTLAEIARRREVKLGTIYTQFSRALEALRAKWRRQTRIGTAGSKKSD
jgi:RNA polymerase sigma factor (sigma-70 family)